MLIPCHEVASGGLFFIFHHEEKTYTIRLLRVLGERTKSDGTPIDLTVAIQRNGKKLLEKDGIEIAKAFHKALENLSPTAVTQAMTMNPGEP